MVTDITETSFKKEYNLINLSNILTYYFKSVEEYIKFLENNFTLKNNGEIINYFFDMNKDIEIKANQLLQPNGYVEDLDGKKLLVYKR